MRPIWLFLSALLLTAAVAVPSLAEAKHPVRNYLSAGQLDPTELLLGNAGANASLSVRGSLFEKIVEELIPLIDQIGNQVTIPGESEKHFSFNSFSLEGFAIGNITIQFASPSNVIIGLKNIQLTVPKTHFDVFTWIIFKITCGGNFWGSVSGTNIYLTLEFSTNSDGSLVIDNVLPDVTFGSLNVNHHMDSFLCRVGEDIIELFLGNLNKLIKKVIEQKLPTMLGNGVLSALQKALAKLTLKFATQPAVVDDTLTLDVELVPPVSSPKAIAPPTATTSGRVGGIFLDRDISIGMSAQSINDLLADVAGSGKLELNRTLPGDVINTTILELFFPNAYHRCEGCPFSVDFDILPDAPLFFQFHQDTIYLTIPKAILGFNAVNTSDNSYDPLFDVYTNMTLSLSDVYVDSVSNKLFFQIGLEWFEFTLDKSIIGFDVEKIGAFLDHILKKIVIPLFNMSFKGIELKLTKDGVGLEKLRLRAEENRLTIGADVLLPNF